MNENKFLLSKKNRKYFTQQERNEGIFDSLMSVGGDLLGNLLPGLMGDVKQKIVTGLLEKVGLNPKSKIGRIIINIFEEFKYTQLMEYFSDWKTGCPKFVDTFLKALSDALLESLMEDYLGMDAAAKQSGMAGTIRETLTTTVNDKLVPVMSKPISEFICNLDMGGIMQNIKNVASGGGSASSSTSASGGAAQTVDKTAAVAKQFGK